LADIPGLGIDPDDIETNLVFFDVNDTGRTAAEIVAALKERGVRMGATGKYRIRAVTHLDISREDIDTALRAVGEVVVGRA